MHVQLPLSTVPRALTLLTGLFLVGCGEPGPDTLAAQSYAEQLEPLLYENGLLADQLYETAAAISNEQLDAETVEVRWQSRIAPVAEHLVDQAELVQPPAAWETRHDELVSIWRARAEGYRAISQALERGDREAWREGRKKADDSKIREERWFIDANRDLATHGVTLDQLP
ncbi:MAG: hypothetical protein EP330_03530 [Deltaproteobacteria bacterium]|nr:MAG: hypothetical protein EP330_03530 [Deltaproteobacteria bacterium]